MKVKHIQQLQIVHQQQQQLRKEIFQALQPQPQKHHLQQLPKHQQTHPVTQEEHKQIFLCYKKNFK